MTILYIHFDIACIWSDRAVRLTRLRLYDRVSGLIAVLCPLIKYADTRTGLVVNFLIGSA